MWADKTKTLYLHHRRGVLKALLIKAMGVICLQGNSQSRVLENFAKRVRMIPKLDFE